MDNIHNSLIKNYIRTLHRSNKNTKQNKEAPYSTSNDESGNLNNDDNTNNNNDVMTS
jgi:hypothetical protein